MIRSHKTRVGIVRGGIGQHYFSSLIKGGDVISHILENLPEKYKTVDILVDKNDDWHIAGVPTSPANLIHKIDIIWNTSHHPSLSATLDNLSIPTIGNSSFQKILEKNSEVLRSHMKKIDVKMPKSVVLPVYQQDFDGPREKYSIKKAKEIFEKFSSPWIVKSFTPDANEGIHLAKTFPELVNAIEDGVAHKKSILVEEFILGKAVSVHSISGFRGEEVYILPLMNFIAKEKDELLKLVKDIHKHLNVNHYLKSDFILHPKRGLFLTNISFLPDLRKESHFEQSCESVGAKMHHMTEHLLEKALNK